MSEYKYRIISTKYTKKTFGWNNKMGKIGDIIISKRILNTSMERKQACSYKGYIYQCKDLELINEYNLKDIYE